MHHRLISAAWVISAMLLTGCSSTPAVKMTDAHKQATKAVRINPKASIGSDAYFYQGPAQSWGMGVGGVIGAVIGATGTSSSQAMQGFLNDPSVDIAQLVPAAFKKELVNSGKLSVPDDASPDAPVMSFEIQIYGLGQTQGFSSTLYPTIALKVELVNSAGQVIWRERDYITPQNKDNDIGAKFEEYAADRELLRRSFEKATAALSRIMLESL